MATTRRGDSKAALAQQRAELRRAARGKGRVGDDTGSAQGRAAELAKVHRMQELLHEEQRQRFDEAARVREAEQAHEERLREPLLALALDLVADGVRVAATLAALPFRLALALRPRWLRGAEA